MIRIIRMMLLSVALYACAAEPTSQRQGFVPRDGRGGAAGSPSVIDIPPPACPPDNPFCTAAPMATGNVPTTITTTCEEVPLDLQPAGINIMLGIDGSASMNSHWPAIQTAIRSLVTSNPSAQFGIQLFWGDAADVFAMETTNMSNNVCSEIHNKLLDVGTHTADAMVSFLGAAPPGPTAFGGVLEISPVIDPLNYYLTNATKLADPKRTNYLVLVTDGNDNCFGSYFTTSKDKLLAFQKLATELNKQNIRIIPVGFDGASMAVDANIFTMTKSATDLEVLRTLLEYGGKVLPEVPKVDDPQKLAAVITQVGQGISNCRFEIPASLDPNAGANPFELSFSINGKPLARDRHNQNGWNFANGSTSQVELFGDGCQAIRSGQQLKAHKSCATNICGTSVVKVETKPRAVLLLLDSSASRIECADGSFGCLSDPNSTPDRPPSFWEVVQNSVSVTLSAAINDDVEFGMQFFPRKNAEAFSCDVAAEAEIAPAQGTEITVMKKMLEKLPFGWSPVVQVIESVAANPGRLADPNVLGSVVLLSDGGDNCSGEPQPQIVSRIGAAAKKLHDMGIKTYAVRFGSEDGRTPEAEEQLRALVTHGGTARTDPADPTAKPYVDAENAQELGAALAEISDRLATCSFGLTGLPAADADKDNANLYLNGEAIPFDKQGMKQNGWNWLDAGRTSIELYGESCTAFKTNRRTSVVVEFGCPPVVLL
jgi:hypothetical protein